MSETIYILPWELLNCFKFDQVNLQNKVDEEPVSYFKKTVFSSIYEVSSSDSPEVQQFSQRLLWMHQEYWQQKLCVKYGNTISLIDTTYKTTNLPLFFLFVSTQTSDTVQL